MKNTARLLPALIVALCLVYLQAWITHENSRERIARWEKQLLSPAPFERPAGLGQYGDIDCHYWHLYAREMLEKGLWRVRRIEVDNAPWGREVHWSSSYAWWMVFLAKGKAMVSGGTPLQHLQWAGDVSGPVLHGVFLLAFVLMLARRVLVIPLSLATLLLAAMQWLVIDFSYMRPDHHGLHLGFLTLLYAALARALWPEEPHRERWAVLAGVFGAAGFWVGATVQLLPLGFAALGGVLWPWLRPFGERADAFARVWRFWAVSGGLATLGFYLLEYAPGPFPQRLEMNHPLYALAFWGMGWFAAAVQVSVQAHRPQWRGLAAGALAVMALAAVIVCIPASHYTPKDPHITSLLRFGIEVEPILQTGPTLIACFLLVLGMVTLGIIAMVRAHRSGGLNALAVVLVTGALPILCLAATQRRWAGIAMGVSMVFWLAVQILSTTRWMRTTAMVFAGGVLVTGGMDTWRYWQGMKEDEPSELTMFWLATRDLSTLLREVPGQKIVMNDGGNPSDVLLAELANSRLVTNLYWECIDGIRDADDFFRALKDEEAWKICERRGVTHVLVRAQVGRMMTRALAFDVPDARIIKQMMVYRLSGPNPTPPAWLKPVSLPPTLPLQQMRVRLYRVEK